jgi:glycosyltransferase involved in cell wall biosynthesis
MNAFTDMRELYFKRARKESFAEYYLAHRCYVSEQDDAARYQLRDKIASVRLLYETESVTEADILHLLAEIGENLYLDRYMVELIILHKDLLLGSNVQNILIAMISEAGIDPQRFSYLVDICIECSLPLLREEALRTALFTYRNDLDVFSLLLDYMLHFSVATFSDILYKYLAEDLPENIKLQIISILIACNPNLEDLHHSIQHRLPADPNLNLYLDFLRLHCETIPMDACGIVVIQPMFYGDPEHSGKGQSGGLGTLLKTLGNQLSKQQHISQVITLSVTQDWNEQTPLLHQYEQGHWLIRLPVYLNMEDAHAFVKREMAIKRTAARFLTLIQIKPDLFHIRYLDNASKAMALLSKEMHAKLVFTLTPDPHRNMVDANGDILCFKVEETLEKLNKISIGDELLAMTDGIVGIGGESVKQELELYFPQLNHAYDPSHFRMIGEGIHTEIDTQDFDVWKFIDDHALRFRIPEENRNRPVILNVGRFSRQKGQHNLLKAWGESRLWKDFNLVIIGGGAEAKKEEEQEIASFFDDFMSSNPNLNGRFAHVEALPNEAIRRVERKLMESKTGSYPNLYVCSSAKEEFGISILEAISEGFLAFAPVNGGAKTYLVDGVNGFLIDTANESAIREDLERVIYQSKLQLEDYEKIQHAGKRTVLDQFSIEKIAGRFVELYLGLNEGGALLCVAGGSL